jgi:hemerythrin-like metal-binding protein
MPLLQWLDEYEIGIPQADHEHLALINVINLLGERLDARFGAEEIRQTLGEIRMLIAAHFGNEERIMRDMRYERYAEHKADHDRLLAEIAAIMVGFESGGSVGAAPARGASQDWRVELGGLVSRWFARHFEKFDAPLHILADRPRVGMRE